jgi:hypothetical protein
MLLMSDYSEDAALNGERPDSGVRLLQMPYLRRELGARVRGILDA